MSHLTKIITALFLLCATVGFAFSASAQETNTAAVVVVAEIEARDFNFLSQNEHEVLLSFVLENEGDTVQSDVRYAVEIWTTDPGNEAFQSVRVHTQVFDETLTLAPNGRVERTITYKAPSALNGLYDIRLMSKNSRGLPFASASLSGPIRFQGQGVSILPETCFANIGGVNRQYTLREGADLSPEEILTLTCLIQNNSENTSITPVFTTYERTVFGPEVATERGDVRTVSSGIEEHTFMIPVVDTPQAYDVVVLLDDGVSVSTSVTLHYVVQGASATVQNVRLDKAHYTKGDTASVSLFISGIADQFYAARSEERELTDPVVIITLRDGIGRTCAESITQPLNDINERSETLHVTVPVTQDCENAGASVSVADISGTLDVYEVGKTEQGLMTMTAIIFLIIVVIVLILMPMFRSAKQSGAGALMFLLIGMGTLLGATVAEGKTYLAGNGTYSFSVNLNKSEYVSGENVRIDVSDVGSVGCYNYGVWNLDNAFWDIDISPTVNWSLEDENCNVFGRHSECHYHNDYDGIYPTSSYTRKESYDMDGCMYFGDCTNDYYHYTFNNEKPAPEIVGYHTARFIALVKHIASASSSTIEDSLPFTVVAPTPDPPPTPAGLYAACSVDGTQVTVSWNSVSGATSYPYRFDKTPFQSDPCQGTPGDECSNSNTSTSQIFSIDSDIDYRFWVHAKNDGGWSDATTVNFNCASPPLEAVHGSCGSSDGQILSSAPLSNLCASGIASTVSGSGPWYWICSGENGGTHDSCSAQKEPPKACSDGIDNDGDGWADTEDPGCYTNDIYDPNDDDETNTSPACSDGEDNDGDGEIDGFDPGCGSGYDSTETGEPTEPMGGDDTTSDDSDDSHDDGETTNDGNTIDSGESDDSRPDEIDFSEF